MLRITCFSSEGGGAASADTRGMSASYPWISSGATTMKMISSTRTPATSGVMLISDCSPAPEPFPSTCMTSASLLVARALGDQTHAVEPGLLDVDHRLPDVAEAQPRVAADHYLGIRGRAGGGAQAVAELL